MDTRELTKCPACKGRCVTGEAYKDMTDYGTCERTAVRICPHCDGTGSAIVAMRLRLNGANPEDHERWVITNLQSRRRE